MQCEPRDFVSIPPSPRTRDQAYHAARRRRSEPRATTTPSRSIAHRKLNEELANIGGRAHTGFAFSRRVFDAESGKEIRVTKTYVQEKLGPVLKSPDLTRYIL